MAMLASKPTYPPPALPASSAQPTAQYNASVSSYRNHGVASRADHSLFASPTESEFSEYDAPDAIRYTTTASAQNDAANRLRHWDEEKVGDWLKRINCAQYVELFKSMCCLQSSMRAWLTLLENHINGENLMEMDQIHLKDMGIKRVGDRVRIGSQAKQLRNKEYKKASRRASNRVSQPTWSYITILFIVLTS